MQQSVHNLTSDYKLLYGHLPLKVGETNGLVGGCWLADIHTLAAIVRDPFLYR